ADHADRPLVGVEHRHGPDPARDHEVERLDGGGVGLHRVDAPGHVVAHGVVTLAPERAHDVAAREDAGEPAAAVEAADMAHVGDAHLGLDGAHLRGLLRHRDRRTHEVLHQGRHARFYTTPRTDGTGAGDVLHHNGSIGGVTHRVFYVFRGNEHVDPNRHHRRP